MTCGASPLLLSKGIQTRAKGSSSQSGAVGIAECSGMGGRHAWNSLQGAATGFDKEKALTNGRRRDRGRQPRQPLSVSLAPQHDLHPFLTHILPSAAPNSPPANDLMRR